MRKKLVFMYGQWVEVTVLPPQPTPETIPTVTPKSSQGIPVEDFASNKATERGYK